LNRQTATVFEVARAAGVSQVTVSRAFTGRAPVAEETRVRIMAAAKRLGYQPNRLAAGLRGGRTRSVGMVWAFANPWTDDAIIALDVLQHQQQRGYAAYQAQYNENTTVLCRQLDDLLARRVDAMIVWAVPGQLRNPQVVERLMSVPTVAVTREAIDGFPGDLVVHDRTLAIRQVVDHLAATGRKRPAMAMDFNEESNPPKYEAFVDQCRKRGIAEHEHMLIHLDRPITPDAVGDTYRHGLRRIFPQGTPIELDAIFGFNDIGAMYVMRELTERGIRVPDDIAVVGFNDSQSGRVWDPPLATGNRKSSEVAKAIDQMLSDRLADPDAAPRQQTVHMEFIRRGSAG
jgi:DNA-binding LacI/PurR family transcriptional regulator